MSDRTVDEVDVRAFPSNQPLFGPWSLVGSLDCLWALCVARPDFVVLDWEHGAWSAADSDLAVQLAHSCGVRVVIRCSTPGPSDVQRAVDTGADAVQVAGVHSMADFDRLIVSFLPPPKGRRGFSPWSFRSRADSTRANSLPGLIPQIESPEALELFLDPGLSHCDSIDAVFVGRYDLSVALGIPGEISGPPVLDAIRSLVARFAGSRIPVGTVATDREDADVMITLGATYLSIGSDRQILADGVARNRPLLGEGIGVECGSTEGRVGVEQPSLELPVAAGKVVR